MLNVIELICRARPKIRRLARGDDLQKSAFAHTTVSLYQTTYLTHDLKSYNNDSFNSQKIILDNIRSLSLLNKLSYTIRYVDQKLR